MYDINHDSIPEMIGYDGGEVHIVLTYKNQQLDKIGGEYNRGLFMGVDKKGKYLLYETHAWPVIEGTYYQMKSGKFKKVLSYTSAEYDNIYVWNGKTL